MNGEGGGGRRDERCDGIGRTITNQIRLICLKLALLSGGVVGSGCRVEQCTRQFQASAMANGGVRRGPSGAFCVILRQYSDCLRSTARSCRGHLAYHTTITLVQNWNVEFNCSYVTTSAVPARNYDHGRAPINPVS